MKKAACLLMALLYLPALGQTWFKVAVEPNTVATTGQTWRYGIAAGTTTAGAKCPCWSPNSTTTLTGKSISDASNGFLVPDPAPGVAKELTVPPAGSPTMTDATCTAVLQ